MVIGLAFLSMCFIAAGGALFGVIALCFPRPSRLSRILGTISVVCLILPLVPAAIISGEAPSWLAIACLFCLAVPGILAIKFSRVDEKKPGHCTKCGYNLTGNVSGKCSECGEPVVAP